MTTTTDDFDDDYNEFDDFDQDDERGISGLFVLVIILAMLLTFSFVVWLAYNKGVRDESLKRTPFIAADPEPVKTVADNTNTVPAEDREVYDRFNGNTTPRKEILSDGPEEPIGSSRTDQIGDLAARAGAEVSDAVADIDTETTLSVPNVGSELSSAADRVGDVARDVGSTVGAATISTDTGSLTSVIRDAVTPEASDVSRTPVTRPVTSSTPASTRLPSNSGTSSSASSVGRGSHVVQVASLRSEIEATEVWNKMTSRFGDYFDGKSRDISRADLGDRGIYYRLRIAGFANSDEAKAFCSGLKARNQDCLVKRR